MALYWRSIGFRSACQPQATGFVGGCDVPSRMRAPAYCPAVISEKQAHGVLIRDRMAFRHTRLLPFCKGNPHCQTVREAGA